MKYSGGAGFEGGRRVVFIKPNSLSGGEDERHLEHYRNAYAVTALEELMHHARESGVYDDTQLARAAFKLLKPDEQSKRLLPDPNDIEANSEYFHNLFKLHCRSVTGE